MSQYILTLSSSTEDDANDIVAGLGQDADIDTKTVVSKGFNGFGEVTLIIVALRGDAFLKQLAQIVVAWMKRHEGRKVKIGSIEITGYSAEEVERILRAAGKK